MGTPFEGTFQTPRYHIGLMFEGTSQIPQYHLGLMFGGFWFSDEILQFVERRAQLLVLSRSNIDFFTKCI